MRIVIQDGGAPLSVDLHLDLTSYCTIAKLLYNRSVSDKDPIAPELAAALSSIIPDCTLMSYETTFERVYDMLADQVKAALGDSHWYTVKTLLLKQSEGHYEKENPTVNTPFTILENPDPPLAIDAMDVYFVELIKNSMDAVIQNYFNGRDEVGLKLVMNIKFHLTKDKIFIVISDNAGGFSSDFLESSPSGKGWINPKINAKKYFFGGNELGHKAIKKMLSNGAEGEMVIKNAGTGAQIIISSLIEPLCLDSAPTSPLNKKVVSACSTMPVSQALKSGALISPKKVLGRNNSQESTSPSPSSAPKASTPKRYEQEFFGRSFDQALASLTAANRESVGKKRPVVPPLFPTPL